METVPSKTARVKSALQHFSNHTVLSSLRKESNGRKTKTVPKFEPIIRERTKIKTNTHHSSSEEALGSRRVDSSDRNTKKVLDMKTTPYKRIERQSENTAPTNDTVASSSKYKFAKHECAIFESVKLYLRGKRLDLSQLKELKSQLSKPHACPNCLPKGLSSRLFARVAENVD